MRGIRRAAGLLAGVALSAGVLVTVAAPAGASPDAFVLYAPLSQGQSCGVAHVDLATGELTPFGATSATICTFRDLALAPDGTLYGLLAETFPNVNLATIDTTTGAVNDLGPVGGTSRTGEGGVAIDGSGQMFAALSLADDQCNPSTPGPAPASVCLYRLDPTALATPTFVGPFAPGDAEIGYGSLATGCGGQMITSELDFTNVTITGFDPGDTWGDSFAAQDIFPTGSLATVDPATGAASVVGGLGGANPPFGFAFDPLGALWATGTRLVGTRFVGTTYSVNTGTGAATVKAHVVLPGQLELSLGPVEIAPTASACEAAPVAPAVSITPTFAG